MTAAAPRPSGRWSATDAEDHLLGLELFGMRFGLDRMRRLLTALGSPQRSFRAIHVVGTNGKSSTVRMTAAILQGHGVRTGAYLSPHLVSFTERVRVGDADLAADAFAEAVRRVALASRKVDRTLAEDDGVTQFEALTAAAFLALGESGVEVAVVEAGLGGRWDATNVLDAPVVVLTNVGLEHTRWLGPTVRDIAREKLAVAGRGATLVLGADLHPDARIEAEALDVAQRVTAAPEGRETPFRVLGAFQRHNFALARAAAEALVGVLDEDAVRAAAVAVRVPGRFERVADDPPTYLDGAHNASGMAALAEAVRDEIGDRPLTAVLSILDDKDAGGMLRALLPCCRRAVLTTNANPRALSPATLESLTRQLGVGDTTCESDPRAALARAREMARAEGGAVLATGSIYLIADLLRPAGRPGSTL